MAITAGTSTSGEVAAACWDGVAPCWRLSRHRSRDVKWGGKQQPSMANPLHLCIWRKVCNSLSGHGEEFAVDSEARRSIGSWLEKVSASSWGKEEELRALLGSQTPPLCSVPRGLQLQNLLSQQLWLQRRQKRDAGPELLGRVWGVWNPSAHSSVPSSAAPAHLLHREMDSLCPVWFLQGSSLDGDLWWPELQGNHIAFTCCMRWARFSVCTSPRRRFLLPSEILGTRGIWHGWDDLVCKWLCSWPGNSFCFSFVLLLGWKHWKRFSKVSTSCPGGKYLQRVPFANTARLNAAPEIKTFGRIRELHPLTPPVIGPLPLWLALMEIFAGRGSVDLLITGARTGLDC